MRLYVICKEHPHEKIYLRWPGGNPQYRNDISLPSFCIKCPTTEEDNLYTASDVIAEEGAQLPAVGAGLGALLFFINPISGLIGTIIGIVGGRLSEEEKVKQFNKSKV